MIHMKRDVLTRLAQKASERGGYINAHSHLDIAHVLELSSFKQATSELGLSDPYQAGELPLPVKMDLLDRRMRTAEDYLSTLSSRIESTLQAFLEQGVAACRTCITISKEVGSKPIEIAASLKRKYAGSLELQIVPLHLYSLLENADERAYFETMCAHEAVDVIGALPQLEKDVPSFLDLLFQMAQAMDKPVEIHSDEYIAVDENETELIALKAIEMRQKGYNRGISAVHCVTLACKAPAERARVIELLRRGMVDVVVCPRAAISMRNLDCATYMHNSIAPVRELLDGGVVVAIGTDNIHDVFLPFSDGLVADEIDFLAEAIRMYDIEKLVDLVSSNGRKVLGLP